MLPELDPEGNLPPGIHAASLAEVEQRFGTGSDTRVGLGRLLRDVVDAAKAYATIKRVLVWGSFVSAKAEPRDLDYSLVVSVTHRDASIAAEHRWFLVALDARAYNGVDRAFLEIPDYPLDRYPERLDFICRSRSRVPRGIVEISLRGEEATLR